MYNIPRRLLTRSILRADQRAKARAALGVMRGSGAVSAAGVVDDNMVYFWQCQSPSRTGDMKGCGFFKILDMRGEGRGPCWGDERGEEIGREGEDVHACVVNASAREVMEPGVSNGA